MLPKGYDPANYGGKIWWNEDNSEMREMWGTQEDYDKHIKSGGNWNEYEEKVRERQDRMQTVDKKINFSSIFAEASSSTFPGKVSLTDKEIDLSGMFEGKGLLSGKIPVTDNRIDFSGITDEEEMETSELPRKRR